MRVPDPTLRLAEIHVRREALAIRVEVRDLPPLALSQTIQMSMTAALSFMADPALAAAVLPAPGAGLDIAAFVRDSGTLYLIAQSDHDESPLAPLFASLAGEIHYTAGLLGSQMPGGRLDPPLLMALDEIVQVCPVPLPSWLADSGGKGIQLFPVTHGEAQLRTRWGQVGAQAIMDTCGVKIWLPGSPTPGRWRRLASSAAPRHLRNAARRSTAAMRSCPRT